MVERYHEPVRRIYRIVTLEIPGIDRDMSLQMTFKAINDTAGPDGPFPHYWYLGLTRAWLSRTPLPRLLPNEPMHSAKPWTRSNGCAPNAKYRMHYEPPMVHALQLAVHDLPLNAPVLVWREGSSDHWSGPHSLLRQDGETCTVDINGPAQFRSTVVKPYYHEDSPPSNPTPTVDPGSPTIDSTPPITEGTEHSTVSSL